jgi:phage regulator Rha-like protein
VSKGGVEMEKLVFLEPDDVQETPFTTSEVIAKHGKVQHHALQQMLSKYKKDIEEFGVLAFEMRKPENSNGGRPEKIYHLNEQQATLLITYMQNTLPVRKFKKALVKQFYIMQKELTSRKVTRQIGKEAREALTNAIQELPESPHKAMKYKHYTDLAYKVVFGKNAKQLREEYGLKKTDDLRNRFSTSELDKVLKIERQISVLIELGYSYKEIKYELSKAYLQTA